VLLFVITLSLSTSHRYYHSRTSQRGRALLCVGADCTALHARLVLSRRDALTERPWTPFVLPILMNPLPLFSPPLLPPPGNTSRWVTSGPNFEIPVSRTSTAHDGRVDRHTILMNQSGLLQCAIVRRREGRMRREGVVVQISSGLKLGREGGSTCAGRV
jgi:hypothetical protein